MCGMSGKRTSPQGTAPPVFPAAVLTFLNGHASETVGLVTLPSI